MNQKNTKDQDFNNEYHEITSEKDGGYYFDCVRINTNCDPKLLRKVLLLKELQKMSFHFDIRRSSQAALQFSYKANIVMVAPSRQCIELISKYLPSPYSFKISYLEVTKDIFCSTEEEAYYSSLNSYRTLRRKYCSDHKIYHQLYDGEKRKNGEEPNEDLFSDRTGYYGTKQFKYVFYARRSKINGKPCLHDEWRILGASYIKKMTGISCINDLLTFKLSQFFDEMDKRYIVHERIDTRKIGKWLLEWGRMKKFTKMGLLKMGLRGRLFCDIYQIKTYADLVSYLADQKAALKKRPGVKTEWKKKILSLDDYSRFRSQ